MGGADVSISSQGGAAAVVTALRWPPVGGGVWSGWVGGRCNDADTLAGSAEPNFTANEPEHGPWHTPTDMPLQPSTFASKHFKPTRLIKVTLKLGSSSV